MEKLSEAAGLLLFSTGDPIQFLLMRHADRWDLPKGHAEPGENILTTALRETEEETGIAAESIQVDPEFQFQLEYTVRHPSRGSYPKRVTYFLGYLPASCTVRLTEHIDYRWWDWPHDGSLQAQTIDPLLAAAKEHFRSFPDRLLPGRAR